jgi:alanine dehydrogenase
VQKGAGVGTGYSDDEYREAGALPTGDAAEVAAQSEIIIKVKEPIEEEFDLFKEHQALFCYLHTETRPALVDMLLQKRITAIAFENIRLSDGSFPLLAPMSIIAGQQALFQGMQFLWNHKGGIGKSLVAYPGLEPPKIVVLGAGQAGLQAALMAGALGAEVSLFEIDQRRIRQLALILPSNVRLLNIEEVPLEPYVCQAEMVINAATVPPHSSYHLIPRGMISKMKKGSVIVDVSANLKGAIETIDHYTTHKDPIWEVDGVIHYAVTNIPGTVARTASQALAMEVLTYLMELADQGVYPALQKNAALRQGLTSISGQLTWRETGLFQKRDWCSPEEALARLDVQEV